jgi:hypothetical protein
VSAQAKPISEVVKEFEQSLENLRPSTRRVYVAAAKTAIRSAHLELWQCPSTGELLASLGESPTETISPFLNFLGDGELDELVFDEDSAALQNWVIQRLSKETRSVKNPSTTLRRDLGMIAALCAAPAKGTPRKWPESCLKSRAAKCCCGIRRSRNPASLSPCVSGMPGESAWPGRINGGSTADLSLGANQGSFSPGRTVLPWAEQPSITLCGDSKR